MHIKTQFSIKDLENLTNVKAHTIRIWEKRYNLLSPERTETNIRKYSLDSLKRILNISFLYHHGFKISKIAELTKTEITKAIENQRTEHSEALAINAFKTAMFEFDIQLFNKAYKDLRKKKSFTQIFRDVFIPLLDDIGLLWQIGTIDPIHESFISESIKQKIILNIAKKQKKGYNDQNITFALFLPYEEVHDIGLMFAHYKVAQAGYKTIYLGSSIPIDDLKNLLKHKEEIIFLTYLTLQPEDMDPKDFIKKFTETTCVHRHCKLWAMGPKVKLLKRDKTPKHIELVTSFTSFDQQLKKLKES